MISNLWSHVDLYCANNHPAPTQMHLSQQKTKFYYLCPLCENKITTQQFEKAIKHISDEITEAILNNAEINLTNYKWKRTRLHYHIIEHKEEKINLEVLNNEKAKK